MNILHTFVKLLQREVQQTSAFVCLFIFLLHTIYFIGIQIFNNGRRKFSKIPLDSTYKYAAFGLIDQSVSSQFIVVFIFSTADYNFGLLVRNSSPLVRKKLFGALY